ncbi:MAG TPA: hypothetical protein VER11_33245 [Polyangiaceae bacterium]|nr:hypothetical protein [Polyangiaceae bacterium]
MNLRPFYALLLASSLIELGGCKNLLKKKDTEAAPSATPVAVPSAVIAPLPTTPEVPATPPPVAVDEKAVPTPQDFEDEAFEKVTPANFKAQFATLKAAISK